MYTINNIIVLNNMTEDTNLLLTNTSLFKNGTEYEDNEEEVIVYSSSYALTLVLFAILMLLVLCTVSTRKIFADCIFAHRMGEISMRRNSTFVAIIEEDLRRQMSDLMMVPQVVVNGDKTKGSNKFQAMKQETKKKSLLKTPSPAVASKMSGKVSLYSAAQEVLNRIREERKAKRNKITPLIIPTATTIKVMAGSSGIHPDVEIKVSPPTPSNDTEVNQRSNSEVKRGSLKRSSNKSRKSKDLSSSQMEFLSPKARGEMFNPKRKY